MKRILILLLLLCMALSGCAASVQDGGIAATTAPVYQFTSMLCQGTGIAVTQLVTESVSCLHDYTLSVSQVKTIEGAALVITSGAGLEDFMEDVLQGKPVVEAAQGIALLEGCHEEGHEGHHHEADPHLWLSPVYAGLMAQNICDSLKSAYPSHADTFEANLLALQAQLDQLQAYGENRLKDLSCRDLITFHDGFSYFAQAFDLHIVKAIEEEAGAEASARELIEIITLVREHQLPAVFTEENGPVSAARVICAETDIHSYALSMAMSDADYFGAMYRNIDTIWEAMQ